MIKKLWLISCILLVAVAFSITIFAVSTVSKPIGSDVYWHLHIAELISKGNLTEAWNYPLAENYFPYGLLLFHVGLSSLFFTGQPYLSALITEAFLMPLTFTLTIYVMAKYVSAKSAFISGLCLLGSLAFVDGSMQLRPESIDILFYPLMLLAILSVKKKSFIVLALATIYSHGIAALSNIYGIAVQLWRDFNWEQWRIYIVAGAIATLPLIVISFFYIEGAFQKWFTLAGTNQSNPQQTLFWTQPLLFIPYYSGLTLFGFVFLFKRNKSYFEVLLTSGVVASAIMIPFWADRWLQYITIPLSCLVGLGLKNASIKKLMFILPILLAISFLYVLNWYLISWSHLWWQP